MKSDNLSLLLPLGQDDCLKAFLSSTFLDLSEERDAVLKALRKTRTPTIGMEDFLASPGTPLDVALENLRHSDVMILVVGFKAGSLLPDGSGATYTSASGFGSAFRRGAIKNETLQRRGH